MDYHFSVEQALIMLGAQVVENQILDDANVLLQNQVKELQQHNESLKSDLTEAQALLEQEPVS